MSGPPSLAAPPQLEIRPGAHEQILQFTGTNIEPRAAINYRVRTSSLGLLTMPEFVVKVDGKPVTVPSAQLEVVSEPPASVMPAAQLVLGLPVTNLLVGQAVQARIVLPGIPGGVVQGLMQLQIERPGVTGGYGRDPSAHRNGAARWGQRAHVHLRNHFHPHVGGRARPPSRKGSRQGASSRAGGDQWPAGWSTWSAAIHPARIGPGRTDRATAPTRG